MFGFERNESNSLEQLCINWSSEKLQHFYMQTVFHDTLNSCQSVSSLPLSFHYPPPPTPSLFCVILLIFVPTFNRIVFLLFLFLLLLLYLSLLLLILLSSPYRKEGVDPLFESEVHDCLPCIELIGNNVSNICYTMDTGCMEKMSSFLCTIMCMGNVF